MKESKPRIKTPDQAHSSRDTTPQQPLNLIIAHRPRAIPPNATLRISQKYHSLRIINPLTRPLKRRKRLQEPILDRRECATNMRNNIAQRGIVEQRARQRKIHERAGGLEVELDEAGRVECCARLTGRISVGSVEGSVPDAF